MPNREDEHIDDYLARGRKELVLMAQLYFSHGMVEKAQEIMALLKEIDQFELSKIQEES